MFRRPILFRLIAGATAFAATTAGAQMRTVDPNAALRDPPEVGGDDGGDLRIAAGRLGVAHLHDRLAAMRHVLARFPYDDKDDAVVGTPDPLLVVHARTILEADRRP